MNSHIIRRRSWTETTATSGRRAVSGWWCCTYYGHNNMAYGLPTRVLTIGILIAILIYSRYIPPRVCHNIAISIIGTRNSILQYCNLYMPYRYQYQYIWPYWDWPYVGHVVGSYGQRQPDRQPDTAFHSGRVCVCASASDCWLASESWMVEKTIM